MKKTLIALILSLSLIGLTVFNLLAADGDLLVGGSVGIGTTSPALPLHTYSNTAGKYGIRIETGSNTQPQLQLYDGGGATQNSWQIGMGVNSYTDGILFVNDSTGGTTKMRMVIDKSGNVGIGTTAPLAYINGGYAVTALDVEGYGKTGLRFVDTSGTNYFFNIGVDAHTAYIGAEYSTTPYIKYAAYGSHTFAVNGSVIETINSNGVGIGTTNPDYTLTVNGTAWVTGSQWSGSDIRWKKNIAPIDNAVSLLQGLRAVRFDWRKDEFKNMNFSSDRQIGLIAQDVEKKLPELVTTDKEGYKAVSYEKLSAVLVEALQEQQLQINMLRAEIEKLKTR